MKVMRVTLIVAFPKRNFMFGLWCCAVRACACVLLNRDLLSLVPPARGSGLGSVPCRSRKEVGLGS